LTARVKSNSGDKRDKLPAVSNYSPELGVAAGGDKGLGGAGWATGRFGAGALVCACTGGLVDDGTEQLIEPIVLDPYCT